MRIVISQSMYFPWIGLLEQLKLADIFVFYDDVQFSKGSFTNRVQIKTAAGSQWLTVPLTNVRLGQNIDQVQINNQKKWRRSHYDILRQHYKGAPFLDDMLHVANSVFSQEQQTIAEVSSRSLLALADYFSISKDLEVLNSKDLAISGSSSQRVFEIVKLLKGTTYITGHGAKNYLDHQLFENAGIAVEYMDYQLTPYSQLHETFTPYVSALDLIANCGKSGTELLHSKTKNWKDFTNEPH